MKIENTLNTKIVALAITLCVSTGLFFSIYSFYQDRDYSYQIKLNHLLLSHKNFEKNLKESINNIESDLKFITQITPIDLTLNKSERTQILEKRMNTDKRIYSMYLLSQSEYKSQFDYLSYVVKPLSVPTDLTDLKYSFHHLNDGNTPKILYNSIIQFESQYYILSQADITDIFEDFKNNLENKASLSFYFKKSFIFGTPHNLQQMEQLSPIDLNELTIDNFVYDGSNPLLYIHHAIKLNREDVIHVYSAINLKSLIADIQNEFNNNLLLLIVLSLISIFVTILITQNIVRPLHQLISLSSKINATDDEFENTDDIERISNTLHHLSEELLKTNQLLSTQKMALDSAAIVAETDSEGRITYVNDNFLLISGYEKEELIGKDHRIINSGFHPKSFYKELWETIQSGEVWKGEIKNKAKDGSYYWVNTTIFPYTNDNNEIIKYVAIRFDISERKLFEQELVKSQEKTEEAVKAKSVFLANMSHEIRTPLNTILGISDVLSEINTSPEQQAHIRSLRKSGETLLHIVNEILDISKIESGQLQFENTEFSHIQLFEEVIDMMSLKGQTPEVEYILDIDPNIPDTLIGDSYKIRQVLINLLGNSSKFTKKGFILLKSKLLKTDPLSNTLSIAITVRDTGRGIEEDALSHIFESYSQADLSISKSFGGTGLGLTIVKQIVDGMEGSIAVNSDLGKGSIFTINLTLPYSLDKTFNDFSIVKEKRILLLDSNKKSSSIFENFLNYHMAKEIKVINNSFLIFKFLEHNPINHFDYIFVDQGLVYDGKPVLKHLKSLYPQKTNSCVAIIDYLNGENLKQLQTHGSGLFITRPIKPTEVLHIFNQITNKMNQENLLIVDDEVQILEVMKDIFSDMNMNIFLAENAEDALKIVSHNKIKGIISDLNLPGKSGLELYQNIQKNYGDIPFIMLSAFLTPDIRHIADSLHIKKLIDKPFDIDYLRGAVEKMMETPISENKATSQSLPNQHKLKILIADDSEDNQNLMRVYMKDSGHDLFFVNNGRDAYNKVINNEFDIVFMDIQMPVMNGIDATQKIRNYEKSHDLNQTTIIALTANVLNKCTNPIFNDYLTKPIKKETITSCINGLSSKAA